MTFSIFVGVILAACCSLSLGTDLSGPNVCSEKILSTEYVIRNESYRCSTYQYFPSGSDECRGRGGRQGCYVYERSWCWHLVEYCETVWKDVFHCCEGYEEDGNGGCQVSIMCADGNGGCDQACVTVEDPYTRDVEMKCKCFEGYEMDTRHTCSDVDECAQNNGGCDHMCDNTVGSYFCSCKNGYRLSDHHNCKEIDECQYGNGMCEHDCHNVPGAHYCTCADGFVLVEGFTCEDRDECSDPTYNHGCELCVNEFGSFHCTCEEGKILAADNKTCLYPDSASGPIDPSGPAGPALPLVPDPSTFVTEGQVSVHPVEEKCPSQAGPIVGGVLGGVVLIILVLLLLFCLYRRGCCDALFAPKPKATTAEENPYDNLGDANRADAFANQMYGGHMITGGIKGKEAGVYDNKDQNDEGVYHDIKGQGQGQNPYDNFKQTEGHYDNPGFNEGEKPSIEGNVYDNV